MPETYPPIDLSGLGIAEIARLAAERKLPPVERWDPPHCGDSQMRIARDSTWYHEGEPIRREALVRLFSTVLRREADGSHVLVTPAEKLDIQVEDTPFVATEVVSEGGGRNRRLAFRLNTGDVVVAGPEHPLRLAGDQLNLVVRGGLEARVDRPVWYELAEDAIAEGGDTPGLWSDGAFFPFVPA
ncbi:DUF1285 domain-containing protein [Sphingomonas sp. ID0503]|uniref:DUF1285 domain-containing protein n=1 Tax=Sphingomonas sp. ID0503 TaxID=3399691 RepID=UPI003AFA7AC6